MDTMRNITLALFLECSLIIHTGFSQATDSQSAPQLNPVNDQAVWLSQAKPTKTSAPSSAHGALHRGGSPDTASGSDSELTITVKGDWVSKYMFRGVDVLDDHGAYQPSVDFGLWGTGLHVNVWASLASSGRYSRGTFATNPNTGQILVPAQMVDSGYPRTDELDEFDYTVYYSKNCLDDFLATEVGMTYYDIFNQDSEKLDFWEWYGKFTLSELPLKPHAYFYYGVPKRRANGGEGWMTCLGVSHSCELGVFPLLGSTDPATLSLSADVWYNGGEFYPGMDTGWTHATLGSALTIPLCENITFTPGVFYQVSMEDSINKDDEWWTQLSFAYSW